MDKFISKLSTLECPKHGYLVNRGQFVTLKSESGENFPLQTMECPHVKIYFTVVQVNFE